jgi:hypothetical protein
MSQPYFERVWGWNSHSQNGDLKTPEILEFDCKGQNTLHWGVIYIIGKLLKCRWWKWAHMGHLDIYNTRYSKKKGWKSNWQFWLPTTNNRESTWNRCMQVECDTPSYSRRKLQVCFRPHPNRRCKQRITTSQSPRSSHRDSSETPPCETQDKKSFECGCCEEVQRILYGGRWWLPLNPGCGESCESRVARDLS